MTIDYEGRLFRAVSNSSTGEVGSDTVFRYRQSGNLVWGDYSGGSIKRGFLIATVDDEGCLDMRYQHVNTSGELQTGVCKTRPELLPDGRLRLHESWQWTSGDGSKGESVLEEIGSYPRGHKIACTIQMPCDWTSGLKAREWDITVFLILNPDHR